MSISPGRGYIFVHIPKTGGTSMAAALEARAQRDDILIGDTPKALRRKKRLAGLAACGRLWKHSTLADIDGILTPEDIASMFCFTLVRNPWDRAVSYYHWLRDQSFEHPAVRLAKKHEFEAFVLHPHTAASFGAYPSASYMRDATGVERATCYIRLEHMEEDMIPLVAHLCFVPEVEHINLSARAKDYRRFYSETSAAHIASLCDPDISRFGYRFG